MKDTKETEEKLKKEYAEKLAAQKKWLDSLEYPHEVYNPKSTQDDYFLHYYKEFNNKVIER